MSHNPTDWPPSATHLAEAADWFCRLHSEDAAVDDLTRFQRWLESDRANGAAYREVCATWSGFGGYASAPQIMTARRAVLGLARRGRGGRLLWNRWPRMNLARAAALVVATMTLAALATAWFGSHAALYVTGPSERRTLTLADGSVVTLDADTRMRVSYRKHSRLIALEQGQACFDVAKDPSRPFRIRSGDETIVALGTQLNVDMIGHEIVIAMIEGHVAVFDARRQRSAPRIDLITGEALHVDREGTATLLPKVNIDHLTAWLSGHLIFDNEPLASAAQRVSRYTHERIEVAPAIARLGISGVFNLGDASAFIEAVASYFPVKAVHTDASTVYLLNLTSGGSAAGVVHSQ